MRGILFAAFSRLLHVERVLTGMLQHLCIELRSFWYCTLPILSNSTLGN